LFRRNAQGTRTQLRGTNKVPALNSEVPTLKKSFC
jgi:hypothetical protein